MTANRDLPATSNGAAAANGEAAADGAAVPRDEPTGRALAREGLVGEILAPGDEAEQNRQETRVRRGFLGTLKRAFRHIPFAEDVVASYHCALDPQTPVASRGILLAALAYFVLPFDVVPDLLAGIGFADDAAVLMAAFTAVRTNIRPEHYEKARRTLEENVGETPRSA